MSSLNDSLRLKASGLKSPAVSGPVPLCTPDSPLKEGQSGGIAKSKQVKNAGSTPIVVGNASYATKFARSIGVQTQSDKTVGHF